MKGRQLLRRSLQFMRVNAAPAALSAIDEERFGIRTARAPAVTAEALPPILDYCRDNGVVLLIARCLASELTAAQAMERAGFSLMDTLVYYARDDLDRKTIPLDRGISTIRPAGPGDAPKVYAVAAEAFKDYYGHYHADPRLDRTKCDEAYMDWAYRSCVSREAADAVLAAVLQDEIVGFSTLKLNSFDEAEWLLSGVLPKTQGKGIYQALAINNLLWAEEEGAKRLIVSTQINNLAVQRVWIRLGFYPAYSYYTFHKWFDRP